MRLNYPEESNAELDRLDGDEDAGKNYIRTDVGVEEFCELSFAGLTTEEQEFTVNWYRGDKMAKLTTSDPTMLTKLQKIARANPGLVKVDSVCYLNGRECAVNLTVPRKLVSIRTSLSTGRELTEEQRNAARERLAKARALRGSAGSELTGEDTDFYDESDD